MRRAARWPGRSRRTDLETQAPEGGRGRERLRRIGEWREDALSPATELVDRLDDAAGRSRARASSRPTAWRCAVIRSPSGTRCSARSAAQARRPSDDPNHHGLDSKATAKVRALPEERGASRGPQLPVRRDARRVDRGAPVHGGGDAPEPRRVSGGLLGCDFSIENGRHRFARVFNGENWNPSLRAPLTQPGANVQAGEDLLAVNGRDLPASEKRVQPVREHGREIGRAQGRPERRRLELPRGDGGAGRERIEPAVPGVDRGQPQEGGHDERREAGVRAPAGHRGGRLHELQPCTTSRRSTKTARSSMSGSTAAALRPTTSSMR